MSSLAIVDLARPDVAIVPLDQAQLCQDCDAITAACNGRCLRCGSQALLSLATVLNRETFDGRDVSEAPCYSAAIAQEYLQYAMQQILDGKPRTEPVWPLRRDYWEPCESPVDNLVKARALIARQIDQELRKAALKRGSASESGEDHYREVGMDHPGWESNG